MPLSEHEQRLLEQLEKQLNTEDPTFASSMSAEKTAAAGSFVARYLVTGILVFLLGLGLILAGVSTKLIPLGVVGFLCAVAGIYLATLTSQKPRMASSKKASQKQSSFMQGLEDKWDKRKDGWS